MKVIIAGAGLTGLMAASALLESFDHQEEQNRCANLQIEIISNGAAASPFVHGISAPLSKDDSIDAFEKDTLVSGQGMSRTSLVQTLCEDSKIVPELMEKMGLPLIEEEGRPVVLTALGSSHPRVVASSSHTGVDIMSKLRQYLTSRAEVKFTNHARVMRLHILKGRFRGALIWNEQQEKFEYWEGDSILLAGGGFCGIYPFTTNQKTSSGDMVAMAYLAGIDLTDLEFVQFEPSAAVFPEKLKGQSIITTMFYEGAVLRNKRMERFMKTESGIPGECVNKDKLAYAIEREIVRGNGTSHGGVFFDAREVGRERLQRKYGSYVKRYMEVGIDIAEKPIEIAPAAHTSLGGILINPNGRTSAEGVYCAGEAAGGIHGANRLGGNAGLETLVFGRRVGIEILRELRIFGQQGEGNLFEDTQPEKILSKWNEPQGRQLISVHMLHEMRGKMQAILQKDLDVIRTKTGMQEAKLALWKMYEILEKSICIEKKYEKLRLENDMLCAALLAMSASERPRSCGCHICEDGRGEGNYHVILHRGQTEPVVIKEKLEGR